MKFLSYFLGVMSPLHSVLTIWQKGKFVGTDVFGHKYYVGKARKGYKRERRWVMYNKEQEASVVPPEWHGWLHHQTDVFPDNDTESFRKNWIVPHKPNMTGTLAAYRPPGHMLKKGKRDKARGDYQAWSPNEDL